ncbi:unnamed protein product [Orchesella dallaii]|uniref:Uncharacterized protein n=1 Tax=Orchesella dallaii TaxID=48710 RepID=A0ABP1RC27_9HEXA
MSTVATYPRYLQVPEFLLAGQYDQTLIAQDFVGRSRISASVTFSHTILQYRFEWQVAILLGDDGNVYLGYRLIGQQPLEPLHNMHFWIIATGFLKGFDGSKWSVGHFFQGSDLPILRADPKWRGLWMASRNLIASPGQPGTMRLEHLLDPRTEKLETLFQLAFWRCRINMFEAFHYLCVFDVARLDNLPIELRTKPTDVCLVTFNGIVKAHLSKLYDEFPGLLGDMRLAPLRSGYIWVVVRLPYRSLMKLVQIMYDSFYAGFERDFPALVALVMRLNMRELHAKMDKWWQENHRAKSRCECKECDRK